MSNDALLQPFLMHDLELPNRVVLAPMTRARAGTRRVPNPLMADYYRQRAETLKEEGNDELPGMHSYRYSKIVDYLLRDVLKPQYDLTFQAYRELVELRKAGEKVETSKLVDSIETLIAILQDMKAIYRHFPAEKFETLVEQITKKIETYEQQRKHYTEQSD